MARVFRGWDSELEQPVAIKTVLPEFARDPAVIKELKAETRLGLKLSHPGIVRTFDYGIHQGAPFITMEFIEGQTLDVHLAHLPAGRLNETAFRKFAHQILDAAGYAHQVGVVHRDLKPANIMVQRKSQLKLMDFGIAVAIRGRQGFQEGQSSGLTVQYCSPEQIRGKAPSTSMDIYSLGCVFYHMLKGQPPFTTGNVHHHHLHTKPSPIPGIGAHINQVIMRCLEKDPRRRFPTAEDIGAALRTRASPVGNVPSPVPSRRSGKWPGALILLKNSSPKETIPLSDESGRGRIEVGRECKSVKDGIRINDPTTTMSRYQARLTRSPGSDRIYLVNLVDPSKSGSNPTALNGHAMKKNEKRPLRDGDAIAMGKVRLRFRAE